MLIAQTSTFPIGKKVMGDILIKFGVNGENITSFPFFLGKEMGGVDKSLRWYSVAPE